MIKGSKRNLNIQNRCCDCSIIFSCADPKASRCEKCRGCIYCGKITRSPLRRCQKCAKSHPTEKQKIHWDSLPKVVAGDSNLSKRPEVRKKISESMKGDLNPARKHLELFRAHIAKYRPGKTSKLETQFAQSLPKMQPQYEFYWYKIDFADPVNKIAVEIQGCWHHHCPRCFPATPHPTQTKNCANDSRKKKLLISKGWVLVEIWGHEMKGQSPENLLELYNSRLDATSTNLPLIRVINLVRGIK